MNFVDWDYHNHWKDGLKTDASEFSVTNWTAAAQYRENRPYLEVLTHFDSYLLLLLPGFYLPDKSVFHLL